MAERVEFYGPVRIYAARRGREWEAWADPFSVAGTGRTLDAAVADAQRNVNAHISSLAEALHEHGSKVHLLCPLDERTKASASEVRTFIVACVRHVEGRAPRKWPDRVGALSRRKLREVLECEGPVGVVPAAVVG